MHEKLRYRVLGGWAGLVCDHPRLVLGIGLLLTAAATVYSVMELKFQPDRNALISTELDWNQRYLQYREAFSFDDLIVLIAVPDGEDGREKAERFADHLATSLLADKQAISDVYWRIDTWNTSPAAVRLLPWNEFDQAMYGMSQAGLMLGSPNLASLLAGAPAMMAQQDQPGTAPSDAQIAEGIDRFSHLISAMGEALSGNDDQTIGNQLNAVMGKRYEYLPVNHGRLLAMMIEPKLSDHDLEPVKPAMDATRKALAETKAAFAKLSGAGAGVDAGLTGLPAIESDETDVTMRDSTIASILAVVLIAVLLVASFHSAMLPLTIVAALLVGVAWSFGFVTLSIGHLQLLSITFTVMLLGLGVAFGIHLVTRFEMVRGQYPDGPDGFRQAMIDAMQTMGPGIATGAITTAAAFCTTLFTDFTGMAEMGLIAGVGILLCLVAMFTVLPALLRLTRPHAHHIKPPADRKFQLYARHWWTPFYRKPWITVVLVLIISIAGLWGMMKLRYDYNLSNLLPRGLPSVTWFERLTDGADTGAKNDDAAGDSIWFGASCITVKNGDTPTALAQAKQRAEAFEKLPSVASVGGIGLLFPPDDARKCERITQVRGKLKIWLDASLPQAKPSTPELAQVTLQTLGFAMNLARKRPELADAPRVAEALKQLAGKLQAVSTQLADLDDATATARLAALNKVFARWRDQLKITIDQALVTRDLAPGDLPAPALRAAVGGAHRDVLLLQVFPRGDVYDPAQLEPFMSQMRTVDPLVTGTVVQIYESTQLMIRAYIEAGIFALVAVFILVLIDFQSITDSLLSLLPVGVGFIVLLGTMGWGDWPLNPANIIVLPLLFGIGVDNGVHMIHRFRAAPDEHPPGLAEGTGKAITLTSLTTIIGFAALLVAHHRGIASLGLTLAMGMLLTMAVCLTVMPSVLEIRAKR